MLSLCLSCGEFVFFRASLFLHRCHAPRRGTDAGRHHIWGVQTGHCHQKMQSCSSLAMLSFSSLHMSDPWMIYFTFQLSRKFPFFFFLGWCIEPDSGEPCKGVWKGKGSQIRSASVGEAWDQCEFVVWLHSQGCARLGENFHIQRNSHRIIDFILEGTLKLILF